MTADLHTKEGWRRFVATEPLAPPARWTRAKYEQASAQARARYDEERKTFHGGFGPILHNSARTILDEMLLQLEVNRYTQQLPLISLVLDGDSTLGKSTLLRTLGWLYEHKYAPNTGDRESLNDRCPVVNVELTADTKLVDVNESILRFLGWPIPPRGRGRGRDLRQPVLDAVRECGVELILVDELNFLKKRYIKHQVVNDHLKWLMNNLPATLVFAGVNCTATTLVAAEQTSWRLKWFKVERFTNAGSAGQRDWQELLQVIESNLLLLDAPRRMLSGGEAIRTYLHRRTQGSIGTLLSLIRNAAVRAMQTGHERIDLDLLRGRASERGAEAARLAAAGQAPRKRRGAPAATS